jgi:hypothetical protein
MLFEQRFLAGIADGSVTATFRRWKRRQALPGGRYRTGGGIIEVDAVDVVSEAEISVTDARRAGYPSSAALIEDLRGDASAPIYRVTFRHVPGPDPRARLAAAAELSAEDIERIDRRLDRLDRVSSYGPWTRATLEAVAEQRGVRAAQLAASLGRDRDSFKKDVRKLKNLGLTISLEVGYELSARGGAYLRRTRAEPSSGASG